MTGHGHTDKIIQGIDQYEKRQAVEAFFKNPIPTKLTSKGYVRASVLDMWTQGMWRGQPSWTALPGRNHKDYPVEARIFVLNHAIPIHSDETAQKYGDRLADIAVKIQKDLKAMGCMAAAFDNKPKEDAALDFVIAVPLMMPRKIEKIDLSQNPEFGKNGEVLRSGFLDRVEWERNFAGAGILCAYLIAKGYASEQELLDAYGKACVDESKRDDIKNLVQGCVDGRPIQPLPEICAAEVAPVSTKPLP